MRAYTWNNRSSVQQTEIIYCYNRDTTQRPVVREEKAGYRSDRSFWKPLQIIQETERKYEIGFGVGPGQVSTEQKSVVATTMRPVA